MDRLEAMSILLTVVEQGSLSAAGRALKVPVPTVSRKIGELESLIGAKLLIRTTRSLILTEAGKAYVAAARRILDQVDEAERTAAGEFLIPKGELVVTAPLMFGRLHVLPIVADFLARQPAIDVRLLLADRNIHIVDDHVDMAVRIGSLPDSSLVATRVGSMRTVICASPALLAARGEPATPADLAAFPIVAVDTPAPFPSWTVRIAGSGALYEIATRPRLTVTTADAALEAAMRGVGVVRLLHYQVADAVAQGRLKILFTDYEREPSPVHLVHAPAEHMPLKMRRFLDFAAPRLRQGLAAL
ncbi:LysR substrate-binding domain-containing protein [Sphingomonas sp. MMS24-J13]|uniref:LysR substrate-binding domain-containing protein n=1 Tax=Sphingomonas sp. MMS24-J13 TaxID=3238686 RepID=UPI00384BFE46